MDTWGRPAPRTAFGELEHDLRMHRWFQAGERELLDDAGALRIYDDPINDDQGSTMHLLGTCRTEKDPATSMTDRYHCAHGWPNLFIVEGSSFVTSGRGQSTLTIQAAAFHAADHLSQFAERNQI